MENPASFYTAQYYAWERRGRGWFLSEIPIQLEPPFVPFYRHGYSSKNIDDGKVHTIGSTLFGMFSKKPTPAKQQILDYGSIEPYEFEERELCAIQIKAGKGKSVKIDSMKTVLIMLSYLHTPMSFEIIGNGKEIIVQIVAGCTRS